MTPGQESVDEYLGAHFPPCRKELDAYRADLRAQVEALGHTNVCSIQLRSPKYRQCTCFQKPVLALIDGSSE